MNILIPCAGLGSRFANNGYKDPKPLIEALGKTLIEYSIESFNVDGTFIFVTRDYGDKALNDKLSCLVKRLRSESQEIKIDYVTSGAAETALKASEFIDNDLPLVIYNSDQYLRWNPSDFFGWLRSHDPKAAVVVYESSDPKNSFANLDKDGMVCEIAVKKVISVCRKTLSPRAFSSAKS
jgi:NDP-sugar pyrophosphorylase family protein